MARFFPISIIYQGDSFWADVAEHRHSPATYHITFQDQKNVGVPKNFILDTKDDKLVLVENSPEIDDEMLKLVIAEIEKYLQEHPLSSDFRL